MNRALAVIALLALSLASGCGPSFAQELPDRFAVLEGDRPDRTTGYVRRATTPDGVVVGTRVIERRVRGSLAFWSEAVLRHLRDQEGYAILSEEDIRAASGQSGRLVRCGRDLNGRSYRYTVAVFVTEGHIFVVDAGGREEAYLPLEGEIEASIAAMRF